MIKSVIIDDVASYRNKLRKVIETFLPERVSVLAEAANVTEGMEIIHKHRPDLVFLDIEMPGGSGFDLLEKTRDVKFDVIFTTVHENYAIRAIKFSALDYLMKPIDPDELVKAVEKHEEKKSKAINSGQLEALFHNLKNLNAENAQVGLPGTNGLTFVKLRDIVRCKSDINYTDFFMSDKSKITVARTLKDVEALLAENFFMRVHDSHLINLHHLRKYIKGEGGIAVMSDGSEIDISRRKKDEFKKRLADLNMIF